MRIIATITTLLATMPAASAADSFYAKFIAERGGGAPCYARTYDEKHLAAHPKQKVVHFFATLSDFDQGTPPKSFGLAFGFRLRNSTDAFSSDASCVARGDGASCSAEGDGGQFRLASREDGLLVTVVERLELEGMESFSPNLADSDDREFRLYRSPPGECGYDRVGDDADDGGGVIEPLTPSISRPG